MFETPTKAAGLLPPIRDIHSVWRTTPGRTPACNKSINILPKYMVYYRPVDPSAKLSASATMPSPTSTLSPKMSNVCVCKPRLPLCFLAGNFFHLFFQFFFLEFSFLFETLINMCPYELCNFLLFTAMFAAFYLWTAVSFSPCLCLVVCARWLTISLASAQTGYYCVTLCLSACQAACTVRFKSNVNCNELEPGLLSNKQQQNAIFAER